jgi:lipopolysaccharide transport system ATP-binding protein
VLSVGDAAFRKKSLEKIREVSHDGRTVLLVSHNMQTVSSLCNSAIVLEQGRVAFPKGNVSNAVDFYHHIVEDKAALRKAAGEKGGQKGYFEVVRFGIYDDAGRPQENVVSGQPVEFRITYAAGGVKRDEDIEVAIGISTFSGNLVSNLESRASHGSLRLVGPQGTLTCRVEKMPLAPGNITISLKITSNGVILSQIEDAFVGMVEAGDFFATGESGKNPGAVFIEQEWAAN